MTIRPAVVQIQDAVKRFENLKGKFYSLLISKHEKENTYTLHRK